MPGTFVSKHYTVPPKEMEQVLENIGSRTRRNNGKYEVQVCNFCDKGNKHKESNQWKLCINDDGSFHCFRCALHGSWFSLRQRVMGSSTISSAYSLLDQREDKSSPKTRIIPDQSEAYSYTKALFSKSCNVSRKALEYLTETRGLSPSILQRYGVGCTTQRFENNDGQWVDHICVTFPWMEKKSDDDSVERVKEIETSSSASVSNSKPFEIARIKLRAIDGKGKQRLLPKGGDWGFFGWHLVRDSDDAVVITEGEFDAMAVAQSISNLNKKHPLHNLAAISLPNGCGSLPPALLPQLERFKKIYLWLDDDDPGVIASEKFSRKLGAKRCFIVKPLKYEADGKSPKDANDALRMGVDLIELLEGASILSHKQLKKFKDFRSEVLGHFMDPDNQTHGTSTPSLPTLTKLTKGFREGELVIFTGPTGSGKTTMLSQLTLDFAKEGAPTLWGSFEIKNSRLLQSMLRQFHPKEKLELIDTKKLQDVADRFDALPLVFMNFHGGTKLEEVLEAMDFAVYQYDIKHIVLDNLQFMLSDQGRGGIDKFDYHDKAISAFRKFCSEKMVNIILVIHPRKDDNRLALQLASIFGTAKATQEADVVIILQKIDDQMMFVDVKKNRFDGDLGKFDVSFNSISKLFYEPE